MQLINTKQSNTLTKKYLLLQLRLAGGVGEGRHGVGDTGGAVAVRVAVSVAVSKASKNFHVWQRGGFET
jgi:hypothetical protein